MELELIAQVGLILFFGMLAIGSIRENVFVSYEVKKKKEDIYLAVHNKAQIFTEVECLDQGIPLFCDNDVNYTDVAYEIYCKHYDRELVIMMEAEGFDIDKYRQV